MPLSHTLHLEVEADLRDAGYSEEAIALVTAQVSYIQPGQDLPEYHSLIYFAVLVNDSASIAEEDQFRRDYSQKVIDYHN